MPIKCDFGDVNSIDIVYGVMSIRPSLKSFRKVELKPADKSANFSEFIKIWSALCQFLVPDSLIWKILLLP